MRAVKLFIKHQPGARVQESQTLNLQRGYGILGDVNALPGNPRQVLIASTSTLSEFGLKPGELKENLLVDTQVEDLSSGTVLQVGSVALIRLTFPCEPCSYLNELQPDLAKRIKGKRGFLGMVVRGGQVLVGDEVTLTSYQFQPLPDEAKGRFASFVQRIPAGKVVKTTDLLMAMGVSKAYARAIPTFLKKTNPHLPIHRIVRVDGRLLSKYVGGQERSLLAEGVKIEKCKIADSTAYWDTSSNKSSNRTNAKSKKAWTIAERLKEKGIKSNPDQIQLIQSFADGYYQEKHGITPPKLTNRRIPVSSYPGEEAIELIDRAIDTVFNPKKKSEKI